MIRCYVVDDEPLARRSLECLIGKAEGFSAAYSTGRPREALKKIVDDPPDVLFLDIKMPGLDGLSLLRQIKHGLDESDLPLAVLVTAFDQFAIQAFDYEALDYLVKPFDDSRFQQSLDRIRTRIVERSHAKSAVQSGRASRIGFKVSRGQVYLDPNEIRWVEASGHYVQIHLKTKAHLVRMKLAHAEELLEPFGLVRVHRSALVNPRFVVKHHSQPEGGRRMELESGHVISVSRRRWKAVECRF